MAEQHMTHWRVLVVDDDAINLRAAARVLRGMGCQGALVADGEKALRLLSEQDFDLMLLDINMPGLSGQDTLKAVRERSGPRLTVFMLSGHGDESTREHFLAEGADGFLVKPLAAESLKLEMTRLARA